MIPTQLKHLKFCRIRKQSKAPLELDWVNKPYTYGEISKFFPQENYGVICGYENLAVIDCDEEALKVAVETLLPETFSVKTGSGGTHFYYFVPELKKKVILEADGKHLGEIQSYRAQVVGVGSIHPNGNTYEIINNIGIKEISLKELEGVLGQFMKRDDLVLNGKEDVEDYKKLIAEIVKVWKEGDRQELALSVSGYLRKEKRLGVNKVKAIIQEVCKITGDEEEKMRLRAVDETFKKDERDIKGFTGLEKVDLGKIKEYQKIKLADLKASLVNELVEVDCQITGEQSQKAIPDKIEVACQKCGDKELFEVNPEMAINFPTQQILSITESNFKCGCDKKPEKISYIIGYSDYAIIFVRDLLQREELTAMKRYEPKRVYVIKETLPNTKIVKIKGFVFIENQTKNLSIICNSITPLKNQVEDFQITEEFKDNSKKYFNSEENIYKQINPDIVGELRDIAKQSVILQLHSPCRILDITRTKQIRGGLNVIFFGDTKVGKSDISKDVTQKGSMPVGEYTICETGGRTGFLYTIDRDKNALIWGSLALNDMGLVVLDGLQSMHSEEIGEFREAIEQQEIIVRRSITGDALARTRILGTLNPNKPMNNYIYPCQALQDTYVFSKTPELTRWDLFIPFALRDVSGEKIAHRKPEEKPIPEEIFIDHIYWVWSRKPEQIIYTDSAVKKINDLSQELIENYSLEVLPIVHNGVRDIVTRISVAMACQMHSTDTTDERVIVETEHVERAIIWYKKALELLELAKYKQDIEGKSELRDNECIAISKELGETEWVILEEIKHEGKSSAQLSEVLELTPKTIKEHYKPLQKHGLIEASTGKGITLSIKGIKFVRWGMSGAGNIVTNGVTKKEAGNEKGYYLPSPEKGSPLKKYLLRK